MEVMELETTSNPEFKVVQDRRPRLEEPLPVKLVAVADMRLSATAGLERELDEFYVTLLEFQRHESSEDLVYQADNFRLCFDLVEGLVERQDFRPVGVEVLSLADAEHKLIEREIEYLRQKAIQPGHESLLVQDPAGNWIEITEHVAIG